MVGITVVINANTPFFCHICIFSAVESCSIIIVCFAISEFRVFDNMIRTMIDQIAATLIHQLILMSRQMLIGQDQASAVEAAAIVYEVIIDGGEHVYVEVGKV